MSETAPETPGGRRFLGLKPKTLLIVGGVTLAAAVGYFWWKRTHSAAATSSTAVTSTSTASSGQLAEIQSELDYLLSLQGQGTSGGSGGGSTAGGGTGTATGTTAVTTTTTTPPATGGGSTAPVTTGPNPPRVTAPAKTAAPGAVAGVHATKVTPTSIGIGWTKTPGATSYRVRVTYQDKLVKQVTARAASVTVSGLTPDHTYGVHVAATGPGGTGPEGDVSVKTSKS